MIPTSDIVANGAPAGWRTVPFWSLFRREKKTGFPDEELLSVYRDYGVIPKSSRDDNHNKESEDLSGYQLVTEGALVTNKMKAWQGSIAISRYQGIVSPAYYVYTPQSDECDQFLHYLLRSDPYIGLYGRISKGVRVNQWDLEHEALRNIPVLLPDLATQRQIADFLDRETARIDLLIEKKQRLVALLGERFNARRNVAFRQIPSSQYRPLRWLVSQICDGPFGSGLTSAHYTESGVRVIRLQNIKDGGFDGTDAAFISEKHYATLGDHDVNAGDLLIAGLGDEKNKVGRACVAPDNLGAAMVKADCYRVRLDAKLISHQFTAEYLCSDESWAQIDALAKGVTRSRLNLELVRRIRIPVPSLEEQGEIVAKIREERRTVSSVSDRVAASIDRLKEYRSALITAAVTGQIDVTTYAKSDTPDQSLDAIQEEMGA